MMHTVCDFYVRKEGNKTMYFYLLVLRWKDRSILSHLISFGNFQKLDVIGKHKSLPIEWIQPQIFIIWWHLHVVWSGKAVFFVFPPSPQITCPLLVYRIPQDAALPSWLISSGDTVQQRAPRMVALTVKKCWEKPGCGGSTLVGAP